MMLGTFGLRPKATLRARALGIAAALSQQFEFSLTTTPWDRPADRGKRTVEQGVPVLNTRSVHPLIFPLAIREMIRETQRHNAKIVHLFKPKGFGDLAARRLVRQLPVVVDMDDWEGNGGWNDIGGYGPLERHLFDWQERTWPRKAASVTVASRALQRRALDLGASDDAVFYVPNGLTRDHFRLLHDASRDDVPDPIRSTVKDRRVLLLYTRFVEFPPTMAAKIIVGVREQLPDAVMLIVGASAEGRAEEELRVLLRQSGATDSVIFTGWSEPATIPALLQLAEVAVHPFDDSVVNRSKCSVKLLELMASGIPVVTNSVGENASMIEDGVSGILAAPGSGEAMIRYAVELLRDRTRSCVMGDAAQRRVANQFLWEQIVPTVARAYEHALESQLAPRS